MLKTMRFKERSTPWSGVGQSVSGVKSAREALHNARLDWSVLQTNVYAEAGYMLPGFKANVRSTDFATLGIVTDRYKVVQNEDAFTFLDNLMSEGVSIENAGEFQGGKKVWVLAKLPKRYVLGGDEIDPYMVLMNSHDGSSGMKVAMTPIRVVCHNTLNLAFKEAKRSWSTKHTENIYERLNEAKEVLIMGESYMVGLGKEIDRLSKIRLSIKRVESLIDEFFPTTMDMPDIQRKNNSNQKADLSKCYFEAPDLMELPHNGYRFVNAVSDFATHSEPIRKTKNYRENLFLKLVDGNALIDKASRIVAA